MSDFPVELERCMESRGVYIRGKINYNLTDKFQRFAAARHHKRSKDLFVVLHNYDRGATFGDWHYPEDWFTYWNKDYGRPTPSDLARNHHELQKRKQEQAYERSKREWRARELWAKFYVSHTPVTHPYVINKRINPYYARQVRSWLLIPVRDIEYKLITLQLIKPDGFKRLWKGTSGKDLMIWLCDDLPEDYCGIIRVCEGYATGATIHQVTKSPVVCSLGVSNLKSVVISLRQRYVHAIIKICADNDQWGNDNVGLTIARSISLQAGVSICYPDFANMKIGLKPTDFNDLFQLTNAMEVKRQLMLTRR